MIRLNLRRHADRKDSATTGLTRKGINQARAFGRNHISARTKLYFGAAKRTQNTGRLITQGAKRKIKYVPRQKAELTTTALNRNAWEAIVKANGSKEKATREWLLGKVPPSVVIPPAIAADKIIKRRLGLAFRLIQKKKLPKQLKIENITHQENIQAVIERLTGQSSENLLHGKHIRPLEKLGFTFEGERGNIKVIMQFRGQKVDVTKRFEKIIALPKEQEGASL